MVVQINQKLLIKATYFIGHLEEFLSSLNLSNIDLVGNFLVGLRCR